MEILQYKLMYTCVCVFVHLYDGNLQYGTNNCYFNYAYYYTTTTTNNNNDSNVCGRDFV